MAPYRRASKGAPPANLHSRTRRRARGIASPTNQDKSAPSDEQVTYGPLSLHELFEQHARQMLDRTDLDEEHKQSILAAMSCPCCGGSAMSYTVKLKR